MRSRQGAAAILLVLALAIALILVTNAGSEPVVDAAPLATTTSTGATTTTIPTTTSTVATTTTTTAVVVEDGPPTVDLHAETFEELRQVWDQIDAYWAWLNAHPTDDPAVLGVIFHPDGIEFARQMETMGALLANGWHVRNSDPGDVLSFTHPQPEAEMKNGSITIGLRTTDPLGADVLDSSDQLVEKLPGWSLLQWQARLVKTDDARWLVWSLDRS